MATSWYSCSAEYIMPVEEECMRTGVYQSTLTEADRNAR